MSLSTEAGVLLAWLNNHPIAGVVFRCSPRMPMTDIAGMIKEYVHLTVLARCPDCLGLDGLSLARIDWTAVIQALLDYDSEVDE
jgi:hypothetical protein